MTTQSAAGKITIAVVVLLGLHGCRPDQPVPAKVGPETTITVEVSGAINDGTRDEILRKLKDMLETPRSGEVFGHKQRGTNLTVELSPVSDVQAFSKRIDFGKVTEVKDRTVKVEVK
jgi:hypothetical protein